MPGQQVALHSSSLSRLSKHGCGTFHESFAFRRVLFVFGNPPRACGQGREADCCYCKANEGLEMSARSGRFDILHHSQLVFSAEMSDQLTALPLTFNRKTEKQMQVGLAGPGWTDRRRQLMDCWIHPSIRWAHLKQRSRPPRLSSFAAGVSEVMCASTAARRS